MIGQNLTIYGLAKRALPGAIDGMSGQVNYQAIDLVLRSFGVKDGDPEYSELFTGVFYYLLSYRSSMFNRPQKGGRDASSSPQKKVLGKG